MPGLATEMLGAFEEGYALPGRLRAQEEAVKQYGERANNPGLFRALEQATQTAAEHDSTMKTQSLNRDINASRERRAAATHGTNQQVAASDRKRKAVLGLVNGLRSARDQGQDIGEAFDQHMETLSVLGVDEADIPEMRQAVVDNPDVLDDYLNSLSGKTPVKAKATDRQKALTIMNDPSASAADKTWAGKIMGIKPGSEGGDTTAKDVSAVIDELRDYYTNLDKGGGMVNPDEDVMTNSLRWLRGTWGGRALGRAAGTENESFRRSIESIRPHLLLAVKAAEDLGARMFDSNKDMEMWLSTVTDPSQDKDTVDRALAQFERQYGEVMGEAQRTNKPIAPGFVDPETGATFKGGDPSKQDNWEMP